MTTWLAAGLAPRVARLLSATFLALLLPACGDMLSKPYPEKQTFGIEPGAAPANTSSTRPEALAIRRLRVAPPYNQRSFIHKTGPAGFRSDYYAGFIAMPDQLLTTALTDWLTTAHVFRTVVPAGSAIPADLTLEGNVTALYADDAAHKAVLNARFFLLRDTPNGTDIVLEKPYVAEVPVRSASPEALAEAFSAAYRRILTELTADLASVPAPTTRP